MLKGGYQIIRFNPNIEITENPVHVMFSYYDASHSYQKMTRISGMLYDGQLWDDFNIVFDRSNSDDLNGNIKAELVNGLLLLTKLHITSDSMVYITKEMLSVPESFVYREITKDVELPVSTSSNNALTIKLKGLYNEKTDEMVLTDYDIVNWKTMTNFSKGKTYEAELNINVLNSIDTISNIYFALNMSWYSTKIGQLYLSNITVGQKLSIKIVSIISLERTNGFTNKSVNYFINKKIAESTDTSKIKGKSIVIFVKNAYGRFRVETNSSNNDSNMSSSGYFDSSYKYSKFLDIQGANYYYTFDGYNRNPSTLKLTSNFSLAAGASKSFTGQRVMQNSTIDCFSPFPYIPNDKLKFTFKIQVGEHFLDGTTTVSYSTNDWGEIMMVRTFSLKNNNGVTVTVSKADYTLTDVEIIN